MRGTTKDQLLLTKVQGTYIKASSQYFRMFHYNVVLLEIPFAKSFRYDVLVLQLISLQNAYASRFVTD